jgi:molecular chaperone GrpE (heat shock protein)
MGRKQKEPRENAKRFSAEKAVTRLLEIIQSIER